MKSLWNDDDAAAAVARWTARGASEPLALRTYTARLLGSEPKLVLHGGGNTSVKTTARDLFGETIDVLHVKGSGWDLATIEPAGHPAVRLGPLLRLRALDVLADEHMVGAQRQNLIDADAPTPSVETLLHAFIPETFIDHTHSTAMLALANQPDADALIERLYGGRVACVPYVMPGFALARAAADAYDARPGIEGLVLLNHGVFSFGATARESYERMIDLVTVAEDHIRARWRGRAPPVVRRPHPGPHTILPLVRGLFGEASKRTSWTLDLRDDEASRRIADHPELADLAKRGVATPDHVIRTKAGPLTLTEPTDDLGDWRGDSAARLERYSGDYRDYFARQNARVGGGKQALDDLPRVVAIPSIGLVGVGRSSGEAAVAADIAGSWASTLMDAEAVGRFTPVGEADTFDMEYWSLEQAKLGKAARRRMEGCVVAVTGAAGAIGAATARAFAAEGAGVALLDLDGGAAERVAASIGAAAFAMACDVTDSGAAGRAVSAVVRRFGGLDILVSNAGSAVTGGIATLDDATLRRSFDLNLFGHQNVAREAVKVFMAQRLGGVLLFNASKQALNPGPDFGAYGAAKAALLALMRQYALEHGADGVRSNAINPDRIRSGLLTPEMIDARAEARGVAPHVYMAGNLLGEEVTAEDVAQAFVFAALMRRTTGAVITVDGGNVAAMVR
jgi:rhamnose utilization protein RhaD (predicted bifunctional aldolase and dehydrogenase)/NAD(P)-dependent dehydrogenase (short-subunit alcohol dehydrogenase family)